MQDAEFLRSILLLGAEATNNLSGRIARQLQDGEPLGELDIINELHRIALALAQGAGLDTGKLLCNSCKASRDNGNGLAICYRCEAEGCHECVSPESHLCQECYLESEED